MDRNTNLGATEERSSRTEMKSPGQRRGDGGGRGFHSEMAREGALAHLPSQYGRASRPPSVACHRSSRKCAAMTQARERITRAPCRRSISAVGHRDTEVSNAAQATRKLPARASTSCPAFSSSHDLKDSSPHSTIGAKKKRTKSQALILRAK
jgi:hypothetical protein